MAEDGFEVFLHASEDCLPVHGKFNFIRGFEGDGGLSAVDVP